MRIFTHLSLLAIASAVAARSSQHIGKTLLERSPRSPRLTEDVRYPQYEKRQYVNATSSESLMQASLCTTLTGVEFAVNGSAIPDVDFDIGESYAGLLPISSKANETRELYFWYFPSTNPLAEDEITIWLNGGPGCSSLEGLLQENGPFLWQYGTFAPVPNPWVRTLWSASPVSRITFGPISCKLTILVPEICRATQTLPLKEQG